jgi:hypothetical protein
MLSDENLILIGLAVTLMLKKINRSKCSKRLLARSKHRHTNLLNAVLLQPTKWHHYLRTRFDVASDTQDLAYYLWNTGRILRSINKAYATR